MFEHALIIANITPSVDPIHRRRAVPHPSADKPSDADPSVHRSPPHSSIPRTCKPTNVHAMHTSTTVPAHTCTSIITKTHAHVHAHKCTHTHTQGHTQKAHSDTHTDTHSNTMRASIWCESAVHPHCNATHVCCDPMHDPSHLSHTDLMRVPACIRPSSGLCTPVRRAPSRCDWSRACVMIHTHVAGSFHMHHSHAPSPTLPTPQTIPPHRQP